MAVFGLAIIGFTLDLEPEVFLNPVDRGRRCLCTTKEPNCI